MNYFALKMILLSVLQSMSNNLVLAGLKTMILRFVHSIRFVKYVSSAKYASWKLQPELWNTNHESLIEPWKGDCNCFFTNLRICGVTRRRRFFGSSYFLISSGLYILVYFVLILRARSYWSQGKLTQFQNYFRPVSGFLVIEVLKMSLETSTCKDHNVATLCSLCCSSSLNDGKKFDHSIKKR